MGAVPWMCLSLIVPKRAGGNGSHLACSRKDARRAIVALQARFRSGSRWLAALTLTLARSPLLRTRSSGALLLLALSARGRARAMANSTNHPKSATCYQSISVFNETLLSTLLHTSVSVRVTCSGFSFLLSAQKTMGLSTTAIV